MEMTFHAEEETPWDISEMLETMTLLVNAMMPHSLGWFPEDSELAKRARSWRSEKIESPPLPWSRSGEYWRRSPDRDRHSGFAGPHRWSGTREVGAADRAQERRCATFGPSTRRGIGG